MTTRRYRIGCGLLAFAALTLSVVPFGILVALRFYFAGPSEYRLPFPAKERLTERDAVELTKRAMILDGKRSDAMRPVPNGHKNSEGREALFCATGKGADEGYVLWWVERPECDWEFQVSICREGDEVICRIVRPL